MKTRGNFLAPLSSPEPDPHLLETQRGRNLGLEIRDKIHGLSSGERQPRIRIIRPDFDVEFLWGTG